MLREPELGQNSTVGILGIPSYRYGFMTTLPLLHLSKYREPQLAGRWITRVTGLGFSVQLSPIQMLALTTPHPQVPMRQLWIRRTTGYHCRFVFLSLDSHSAPPPMLFSSSNCSLLCSVSLFGVAFHYFQVVDFYILSRVRDFICWRIGLKKLPGHHLKWNPLQLDSIFFFYHFPNLLNKDLFLVIFKN